MSRFYSLQGRMYNQRQPPIDWQTERRALPAWLTSMVFHGLLLIVLVIGIRSIPRGVVTEPDRTTGIVLKRVTPQGEYYEGQDLDRSVATDAASATESGDSFQALPGDGESPLEADALLPEPASGFGPAARAIEGGGRLGMKGGGDGIKNIDGGKVRTGVFGVTGIGNKFVYLFDRSGSMEGRPLEAAKQEITKSLQDLGKLNQFEIIFYNEFLDIFHPSQDAKFSGKLFFATDPNKSAAEKYLQRITASGATRHLDPLLKAISLNGDCIFFLTDGTQPRLDSSDLFRIRRRNKGRATINVIQFGSEIEVGDNWLKKIARENGGEYLFFNTDRLSPTNAAN